MKKVIRFRLLSLAVVAVLIGAILGGCTDWERKNMQGISASKRVIEQAIDYYNAGEIDKTQQNYDLLTAAKSVHNTYTAAFESYVKVKQAIHERELQKLPESSELQSQLDVAIAGVNKAADELHKLLPQVEALVATIQHRTQKTPLPGQSSS